MNNPELIWESLNKHFCSFKVKCGDTEFCRNEYNVTGLCNRVSCPLANLAYATIMEHEGECYLYIKTAERAHTPRYLWEKIKLSNNFLTAIQQINNNLKNVYPDHQILRCKHRLTKIRQTLVRARKMALQTRPKLVPIKKKTERREATREEKAHISAKIEKAVENELLLRLHEGAYDGIYNYPRGNFKKVDTEEVYEEEEDLDILESQFVEFIQDDDGDESEDELDKVHGRELKKLLKDKKKVNLEYEIDQDEQLNKGYIQ
ncbi:MAK16 protein, putative [Cryptosporidium muris RN66]|uniref:Protein MAK16 homolog n=1 Tax=Cryptosporidium muris (strain RN66) TaxID=441375 RepID=B6ADM4_CRYMR|nr:MAK16 protein, putative [Cryptosporidium muris RN66]EEA06315.1 MAK16 protein, putative [Cryptosporidium muris RN66]|eukprot:XP_002140664.1 MAK16 protein [Cryptosporidium muris RN66]